MDTFFNILRKGLIATVITSFVLAVSYAPTPHTKEAEAGWATFPGQMVALVEQGVTALSNVMQEIADYVLDGLAWMAKTVTLGMIVGYMLDWVKGGMNGLPTFVTDIKKYLKNVADTVFSNYMKELGALGSWLCDPFKLEIRLALEYEYQRAKLNLPAPECTISDVFSENVESIDDFLNDGGSFFEAGWDGWSTVVSNTRTYTPVGAYGAAQEGLTRNLAEAKDEEEKLLSYGSGFLSVRKCDVDGLNCEVLSPGKIVQEQLSFTLDTPRQNLLEADEINEVLGALVATLAADAVKNLLTAG